MNRAKLMLTAAATVSPETSKNPRVDIVAYSGGFMSPSGVFGKVILDLAGMELPPSLPLLHAHSDSLESTLGQGRATVKQGQLHYSASLALVNTTSQQILALHKAGIEFQASIGAEVLERQFLQEGAKVKVNGKAVTVPRGGASLITKSILREVSILTIGADVNTSVSIAAAAAKVLPMHKKTKQLASAQNPTFQFTEAEAAPAMIEAAGSPALVSENVQAMRQQATAEALETNRINLIRDKLHDPIIQAQAISEGWDNNRVELHVLRSARPTGPRIAIHSPREVTGEMLTAALCLTGGVSETKVGKWFGEQVTNEALHRDLRGMSIQGVMRYVIRAAGMHEPQGRWENEHIRTAFRANSTLQANFSSVDLPGILGNAANKYLLDAYETIATTWQMICGVRDLKDFKPAAVYRLNAMGKFQQLPPTGELKHLYIEESSSTNKLETYGALLTLTRQEIINDDLGAFAQLPRALGRLAAIEVEEAFIRLLLANSPTFFSAGNKNRQTGVITALGIDSLTKAEQLFIQQRDTNKRPLLIVPHVLLVPSALKTVALSLVQATQIVATTTANAPLPNINPHAGRFMPASSPFLDNGSGLANASDTGWYLFADPNVYPAFQIGFLNGQTTPIIEEGIASIDTLGMSWRSYFDFGVAQADPKGAVQSTGVA
ncbi:MAG: hypothetical protein SFX18_00500 [Pirellulales bacterium]|nr:hypothetical protein [Pirellulales bacterium]